MENEKEKRMKLKINFFDIVIIILVVALAGAYAVHRMSGGSAVSTSSSETRELTYVLEITDLNESTESLIHKGDKLIDKVKKYEIGTVESVKIYPFQKLSENKEQGRYIYTEETDRCSAALTVKVKCVDNGDTLTADSGFEIRVGQNVSVVGPGYFGAGYIIGIDRGDD